MVKKVVLVYFAAALCFSCFRPMSAAGQYSSGFVYQALNLPNSARISAMGGAPLAIKDDDLSLALANPSLLTKNMSDKLALSFVSYFAGVKYGFASYSKYFKKYGAFDAGIQYVNYGNFMEADETGLVIGNFSANDMALNIGWARPLDSNFTIGANLKGIYSTMYDYYSFGLGADVALTYNNSKKGLTISLLSKDMCREIKPYRKDNKEPVPFEVQLAMSKKLQHVPLRISLVLQHLEKYDLTYSDPNNPEPTTDPLTGEPLPPKKFSKFADKVGRHIVIGAEFVPSKNFSLRFGYNYQRRQELKVDQKLSTVGFCWGFGIRISKFQLSYARARYHLAGSPNTITISTSLSDFLKKGK